AGCQPDKVDRVVELCKAELEAVVDRGLTEEELERAKGQLRGNLVLGMEDSGSRMSRLGKAELVYGQLLSLDEILARIDAVTLDDVRRVAEDLIAGASPMLTVVGPYDDGDRLEAALA